MSSLEQIKKKVLIEIGFQLAGSQKKYKIASHIKKKHLWIIEWNTLFIGFERCFQASPDYQFLPFKQNSKYNLLKKKINQFYVESFSCLIYKSINVRELNTSEKNLYYSVDTGQREHVHFNIDILI